MDSIQPATNCREIYLTKEFVYACLQDPEFFDLVPVFSNLKDTARETMDYAAAYNIPTRRALWGCVSAFYRRIHNLPAAQWEPQLTAYIQARTGNKPIKLAIPGRFS